MKFGIYELYNLFQPALRRRRFKLFLDAFQPVASTRILDVGGFVRDWKNAGILSSVTCLNVDVIHADPASDKPTTSRVVFEVGDGRNMKFADQSFDIVFSNSVIEHVGTWKDQQRFAAEVRATTQILSIAYIRGHSREKLALVCWVLSGGDAGHRELASVAALGFVLFCLALPAATGHPMASCVAYRGLEFGVHAGLYARPAASLARRGGDGLWHCGVEPRNLA
jgi:hypothetical protein